MKHILLLLCFTFSNTLFSQSFNVSYLLDYPLDTNNVSVRSTEEFLLNADKSKSKFRALRTFQNAMLADSARKGLVNIFDAKEKSKILKCYFNFKLLKSDNKIIYVEDLKGPEYNYESKMPVFDWEILDSNKIINGYNCTKAICILDNKKYAAWFADDIPISNGPYVFGGLPGLILHLECLERVAYTFTVIGLSKSSEAVVLNPVNRFKVKNTIEFIAIKNEYKLAPNTFIFKSGMVKTFTNASLMNKFDDANKGAIEKMKFENFEFDLF